MKAPTSDIPDRYELRTNEVFGQAHTLLEPHSRGRDTPQRIVLELEITPSDIANIVAIKEAANTLQPKITDRFAGVAIGNAVDWDLSLLHTGQRLSYEIIGDELKNIKQPSAESQYHQYLIFYEAYNRILSETNDSQLSIPMMSMPVNRSAGGFQSSVSLANYNDSEFKKTVDAATSRNPGQIVMLAIGRLATQYRLLESSSGNAEKQFYDDPQIKLITSTLKSMGYDWKLVCIDPLTNLYDIRLEKQGSSFLVSSASSGEKELLTYVFAVYGLNLRDALIVIDEPELHLHPRWQSMLLELFELLTKETNNQFVLATHSPVFVSPASIQYVSRVYSENQESKIVRLKSEDLPQAKHLFSIVNSQNNERMFFADRVILVEGISDRLFLDAAFRKLGVYEDSTKTYEIIEVGGKAFFIPYESVLNACRVPHALIADLDYLNEVGPAELRSLFEINNKGIKDGVIRNAGSKDGEFLVERLGEAIDSGNLEDLRGLWEYIKSRKRRLRSDLSEEESEALDQFISAQREDNIFILSKGNLETYLPLGYRSKDINKLIEFVSDDFWPSLAPEARDEIQLIALHIKSL